MVASVTHDVHAAEVCNRTENRVRTVQQRHFALVVRLLALCYQDVQTCFVGRELSLQFGNRHILRLLDNPQVEDFRLNNQVVVVTDFVLNLCYVLAREAGNDTVHERCAHVVVFLEPLLECLIICSKIVFPQLDILADTVFEVVAVQENELARHENQTLRRVAVKGLEAAEE